QGVFMHGKAATLFRQLLLLCRQLGVPLVERRLSRRFLLAADGQLLNFSIDESLIFLNFPSRVIDCRLQSAEPVPPFAVAVVELLANLDKFLAHGCELLLLASQLLLASGELLLAPARVIGRRHRTSRRRSRWDGFWWNLGERAGLDCM